MAPLPSLAEVGQPTKREAAEMAGAAEVAGAAEAEGVAEGGDGGGAEKRIFRARILN